ncbi:uncharacterized protein FTOL_11887 [Fusarium torulosum]|uniref:Uncharacterized protein n=1 Tax=Fusarium torulosum TaxID=33205 RepID=A0AAE8MJ77_9HYPO|nr:uncharacterized protein FTOL_11887 [Fusarium torulosum]
MAPTKTARENNNSHNPKANNGNRIQKRRCCPVLCLSGSVLITEGGAPVAENSAQDIVTQITKLEEDHLRLCRQAAEAEKAAVSAEKSGTNSGNKTTAAYEKFSMNSSEAGVGVGVGAGRWSEPTTI